MSDNNEQRREDVGANCADLLYLAARRREAVSEAKSWLVDCFEDAPVRLLNAVGTVEAVERHYEGGWCQFLRDTFNERVAS